MKRKYFISVGIVGLLVVGAFFINNDSRSFSIIYQTTPEMGEAIIVSFEANIDAVAAKRAFQIDPPVEGELAWLDEYKELHFIPYEGFDESIVYTVSIHDSSSQLAALHSTRKLSFQPQGLPAKIHVRVPGDNTIYYITESGLKRPLPSEEVFHSYPNNKEENIQTIDKKTLALYPDVTLIHLEEHPDIYMLENGSKRRVQNASTFNKLGLNWGAIAPVNYTEFNAYPTAEPILIESLPHQSASFGKFMEVDLDEMKMKLWQDGRIVDVFDVAGKGNPQRTPTRTGLFHVLSKEKNHFSSLSHVWMPWSMRYSGGYFIHEWPYWPGGNRITAKYSAGCVRLNEGDAKRVYDWAEVGTPILVH